MPKGLESWGKGSSDAGRMTTIDYKRSGIEKLGRSEAMEEYEAQVEEDERHKHSRSK